MSGSNPQHSGAVGETGGQECPLHTSLTAQTQPKRFLTCLHYSGEKRLYAFSAHHPLPPNRSLKSAVTPISQVYQPFAGSPTLASSARVGEFFGVNMEPKRSRSLPHHPCRGIVCPPATPGSFTDSISPGSSRCGKRSTAVTPARKRSPPK